MSKLECRTLTHDSPQGKQKVYLCFHPDDFGTYLDAVCDDASRCVDHGWLEPNKY